MVCARCGHESPLDARYCEQCGESILPFASPSGENLAALAGIGFWPRFLARLIDLIAIYGAGFIVIFIYSFFWGLVSGGNASTEPTFLEALLIMSLFIVISWLYDALLESSKKQATLGKMALGLIVVDEQGRRISFARASGRHFAKIFFGSLFAIGYLFIPFTKNHQGLHDLIAGTLVVRVNRECPG